MGVGLKRVLLVGAAAAMVVGLTACGGTSEVTSLLGPVPGGSSAAPTAEPEPVFDPLDTDRNGSVSEFERQVAAQHAAREYALLDGTVVQVDPDEPLSDAVKADVLQRMLPAMAVADEAEATSRAQAASAALGAVVMELGTALGVEIAVVAPAPNGWYFTVTSAQPSYPILGSQSLEGQLEATRLWAGVRFEVFGF